jgi:hypothetical protein
MDILEIIVKYGKNLPDNNISAKKQKTFSDEAVPRHHMIDMNIPLKVIKYSYCFNKTAQNPAVY